MRRTVVVLVLASAVSACGGGDDAATIDAAGGGGEDGPVDCAAARLVVTGDPLPGGALAVVVDLPPVGATVAWTVGAGLLSAPTGLAVSWTLPSDAAVHVAESATIAATVSAPGCADQPLTADVLIDWPEARRTVVVFNPMVPGSEDVALHYAAFRAIPQAALCGVPSSAQTSLAPGEYDAWLDAAMDCIEAVGPQVHYVVPMWGVPYKVQGRIQDLAGGAAVETSLDALLAFGRAGAALTTVPNNPLYQNGDSPTATYSPYVPFGSWRATSAADLFLVARIDGADAAAAMALVDRTAQAEMLARAGLLDGTVYVDGNRGEPHPAQGSFGGYEWGEWNIIGVESVFTALGWYPVVADYGGAEFGTDPAPLLCPDALYYAGWYSYGNYNDVFTWKPGAIGAHLDSCSACDIRGGPDWSAVALSRGITATFGAVNEPYVAGMPEYDQFFAYLTQGASYGEAAYEATILGAWMVVWVGDPLYRPYP